MPLFEIPKRVGFTGTRAGMVEAQRKKLEARLLELKAEGYEWFHHGNCIGADEQAVMIARRLGFKTHSHPSNLKKSQAETRNEYIENEKAPLERNKDIVARTGLMLAAPESRNEERRSGTWSTIRYALQVSRTTELILP